MAKRPAGNRSRSFWGKQGFMPWAILALILIAIFPLGSDRSWADSKIIVDLGDNSSYSLNIRPPSADEEFDVIWASLKQISFYKTMGYQVIFPKHPEFQDLESKAEKIEEMDRDHLHQIFVDEIYNVDDYQAGIEKLKLEEDIFRKVVPRLEELKKRWDFKLQSAYEVILTLYGPDAQLNHRIGHIIVRTSPGGEFSRPNPMYAVVREMVHIGIQDPLVSLFGLDHNEKERAVDLICSRYLGDILKGYEMYSKPSGSLDALTTSKSVLYLPMVLKAYTKKRKALAEPAEPKNAANTIVVEEIFADSQAEKLGLKPGDIIYAYGGRPIQDLPQLVQAVKDHYKTKSVELIIVRSGEKIVYSIAGGQVGAKVRVQRGEGTPE